MEYSTEKIKSMVMNKIKNIENFYQSDFVNYRGFTNGKNDSKKYTEVVAEELLKRGIDLFGKIETITRSSSYKVETHTGELTETNRKEEDIAKEMRKQGEMDFLGEILDYQVPLKDKQSDSAGKIDLLAYDKEKNILRVLELKREDSSETMLRCVLEAYTYLKVVDQEKLKSDFKIDEKAEILAAPLVKKGGKQEEELNDKANSKNLKELMKELGMNEVFCYEKIDGKYNVELVSV